jgi:hypothetical protein
MTLSSGSLVSQGEETPDEYARPRPTEKYWEDYEDWKARRARVARVPLVRAASRAIAARPSRA